MNIFSKFYSRLYQGIFKIFLPMFPYREPVLLKDYNDLVYALKENDKNNIIIVTDKGIRNIGLTQELENVLNENQFKVTIYDGTVPNPTTDNVSEALEMFKNNRCDSIIAFGGGSAMDCAKALGARVSCPKKSLNDMAGLLKVNHRLPILIAIPTTAGTGSEATVTAVITDSKTHHKYTINDFDLIPEYALLDVKLTLGLPKHITSTTGMDALTHAIEAFIGRSTTKGTRKNALKAIKLIFENLEIAYNDGTNYVARDNMLKASYLAGLAFTKSYVGYIHAVAHTLGGKYNVPHGLANAIIMPYVLRMYGKSVYKKLWEIGIYTGLFNKNTSKKAGAKIVIQKIDNMNKNMGIPTKIDNIVESDIEHLAKIAAKEANPLYPVPKLMTARALRNVYYLIKK